MSHPSAKTEFSNDHLGKLLGKLFDTDHNAQWDLNGEKPKLIIHGDLTEDVCGFDIDLEVNGGNLCASVDISGQIELARNKKVSSESTIDTTGEKHVKAQSLIMPVHSRMTGNGTIDIRENIDGSLVRIEGYYGHLNITVGGDMRCGSIRAGANVIVQGHLEVNDNIEASVSNRTKAMETKVIARSVKAHSIMDRSTRVFAFESIKVNYDIAGGAKAFSLDTITSRTVGRPIGPVTGKEQRTFVYAADVLEAKAMPYNAEIFTKFISNNLINPYERKPWQEGNNPWPQEPEQSKTYDNANLASEDMIDFIRLGYSKMQKHFGASMPEHVSQEIHRRFAPV